MKVLIEPTCDNVFETSCRKCADVLTLKIHRPQLPLEHQHYNKQPQPCYYDQQHYGYFQQQTTLKQLKTCEQLYAASKHSARIQQDNSVLQDQQHYYKHQQQHHEQHQQQQHLNSDSAVIFDDTTSTSTTSCIIFYFPSVVSATNLQIVTVFQNKKIFFCILFCIMTVFKTKINDSIIKH